VRCLVKTPPDEAGAPSTACSHVVTSGIFRAYVRIPFRYGIPALMRNLPERMRLFLGELKRRHVLRVAIAYAAVAFILIEAAGNIFPVIGIDERWNRVVVVLALAGFPVAILLSWVFDLKGGGLVVTDHVSAAPLPQTGVSDETLVGAARLDPKTVAVLPFDNLGGSAEDEYFSDGITEEITARLSRIQDLKVVSRTSVMVYKAVKKNVRQIGRDLRAGSVVEGSVRKAPGRVRITAQLIDARSDEHLWAESYDRSLEDIFAIQTDVAEGVARALETELSPSDVARIERRPTDDLDAYDAYLKGRFLWNLRTEDGIRNSVGYLESAIERDPLFALAHAGLADSFVLLGLYNADRPDVVMPRAKSSAKKALSLDPGMGEALTALACVRSIHDWKWDEAEKDFRDAIEANPRYPTAHQWFAMNHLAPRGRLEEADAELARALELDPLSPVLLASGGFLLYLNRRYDEAEAALREILAADPRFALAHFFLGQVLEQQERFDTALSCLNSACDLRGRTPEILTALGHVAAVAGDREQARALKAELIEASEATYVSPGRIAQVCVALGEIDEAIGWLEKAVEHRAVDLIWLGVMPVFDPLKGDERYEDILRRIGLGH